jgi:translocation and assembly module TamA
VSRNRAQMAKKGLSPASLAFVFLAASCGMGQAQTRLDFEAPGASKELVAALKGASLLQAATADAPAQDLFASARADYAKLIGALYGAGYYAPVIHILVDGKEAATIPPLDAPTKITAIVERIMPGPLFKFSAADIAPIAEGTSLPVGFHVGQSALSGVMQDAVHAAISRWRTVGHAKAAVSGQKIIAYHRTATLDARIQIAPGPAVTFGKLLIDGKSAVRDARIRAIAGFPSGAPFDPAALEKSANRLRRTGAFSSVSFTEADKLGPGNSLDVTATLADQKPHRIGFGAELSNSQGLLLSAYWLHRNLFGGAERLRIDAEVNGIGAQSGGLGYKLSARLDRPATFGPDTSLYLLGLIQRENLADYRADKVSLGTGLSRIYSDHLTAKVGIGYDVERVTDITGASSYQDFNLPLGLTFDSRDKPLDAHKGRYLDVGLMPFVGLHGTGTGAKFTLDARGYQAIGSRIVLAGRFQLGSILAAPIATTPRDYLFYSGGGGTVRGQPYQSLGVYAISPTLHTGGRSFMGLSGEARTKISDTIGIVAFYDAGYVGANSTFDKTGGWQAGAGLGLRYNTGIGPIRLDVGAPVSGHTGKGMQIYIGIGQAF